MLMIGLMNVEAVGAIGIDRGNKSGWRNSAPMLQSISSSRQVKLSL
jgi:hypothetical protein